MRVFPRVITLATVLAIVVGIASQATSGAAESRVIEPAQTPVRIIYDSTGKPQQFTIKVGGFKPGDLVAVEQCDGVPATDPKWGVNLDCDTATVPAQANADKDGVVTFPAGDPNFGFQPVVGASPQQFFNCLGPGQKPPNDGVPSFHTCQVRLATSMVQRNADDVYFPIVFSGQASGGSGSSSSATAVVVVIVAIAVALLAVGAFLYVRRRRVAVR